MHLHEKESTLSTLERKATCESGVGHVEHGPINITLTIEIQGYCNNTRKGKPFAHGIPKRSWWNYFKMKHHKLSLSVVQGLEVTMVKTLSNKKSH